MKYSGLSQEEVIISRKENGSNKIESGTKNTFIKLFIESFGDPIIKILLIALMIKVVFLFKNFEWFETLGILIAIFLSTLISSISEYGSESAFKKMQEEAYNAKTKVIRSGKKELVLVDDVVVGDIVLLSEGDKIPADGIIIKGKIYVDESMISGESHEKLKYASYLEKECDSNKVYKGTIVCSKSAYMKITAVGINTMHGKIIEDLKEKSPVSPLKIRLTKLAKIISKIGYIGAFLGTMAYLFSVIVIDNNFNLVLIKETIFNISKMSEYLIYALTLSVTIIVVSVPEGLPMMIALVLSSNMKRMIKDNVLVRRLVGIETSGNINYLLTDKTGTLTRGEMNVSKVILYSKKEYKKLNELSSKLKDKFINQLTYNTESEFSNNLVIGGNSTDKALLKFCGNTSKKHSVVEKKEFDSISKYSAVLMDDNNVYIKGAPEVILKKCVKYLDDNGDVKTLYNTKKIEEQLDVYTKLGYRVIALAYKTNNLSLDRLVYMGLICLKDELRDETCDAIKMLDNASINVIMITGDNKNTAVQIAKECNILKGSKDIVLTSSELNNMSDEEIKKIISRLKIVARAMPNDKKRLVEIIESTNKIVAMTGDGINDAPALKKANVGFAMGSGYDVAKEAADIIILDDNILSICKAILYGRTIFKSIRKFIIFQLTVNLCALFISIIGPLIKISTPITIIQMLWINMIMDTFSGLAFSFETPDIKTMSEPPKEINEPILNKYMYSQILVTGLYSALLCTIFLKSKIVSSIIRYDINNNYLMTAYFALFVFISIFNAFNARTTNRNILKNITKNKVFILLFSLIIIIQLYLIYNGGKLFRTFGLLPNELLFVLLLAFSVIPFDIVRKTITKKLDF